MQLLIRGLDASTIRGAAFLLVLVLGASAGIAQTWTATQIHPTEATARDVRDWQIVGDAGYPTEKAAMWTLPDLTYVDLHPKGANESIAYEAGDGYQVGATGVIVIDERAAVWQGSAASYTSLHPPGAINSSVFCVDGSRFGGGVDMGNGYRASIWPQLGTDWQNFHDPTYVSSSIGALDGGYAGGSQFNGVGIRASLWVLDERGWRDLSVTGYTNVIQSMHAGQQFGVTNPSTNGFSTPRLWRGTVQSATTLGGWGQGNDVFAGQQCGSQFYEESYHNAHVWRTGGLPFNLHDVLPGGYYTSTATGIWDDGEEFTYVVGWASPETGTRRAFLWKSPNIVTAAVTGLNVVVGAVVSGDIESIQSRDDNRLVLRPGPVFSTLQAPVQIIVEGTAPLENPVRFSFSIEAHASAGNVIQTVELYNFFNNVYEGVDKSKMATSDNITRVDDTLDAEHFVEGGTRKVRARISYRTDGPVFIYPWQVRIDKAWWHMLGV